MESYSFTSGGSVKRNQALKVFMLLQDSPKMSQAKACAAVGIDPKTYRKRIANNEEFLQEFEQSKKEAERLELAEILTKQSAITEFFLKEAIKPGLSISERIKALEYIDNRLEVLSSRYHTVDVEAEKDLLSGPKKEKGVSRLGSRSSVE